MFLPPWSNVWPSQGNFTGSVAKELEWAVYPTSSCATGLQAFSFDNSLPTTQAGNPLASSSATANTWPPTYPAGGKPDADINSVNGIDGVGQGTIINVPMIRLNDDFKGADTTYAKLYNYLRFADAPVVTKNTMHTWGYGNHYTTADGRDGWSWDIEVMSNIANGQAGASVVSSMTRMPAATYGDTATTSGSVIKTQYRVTVTSPGGVVSYLSAGI
ncbi:hypothetical protein [Rothia sp. (in: high G+C Gram-positive bacteria)]|uniref:hypothetical protein n=1 Tax=Rothia sp. (in: high G+C Gram-positive bacteria) TaxID=1885016 RepID=UPI003216470A